MPTTKGGLVPAKLINLATNDEVNCMFNPHEYSLTKSNTWERKPVKGKNIPSIQFQQGGQASLKLQLMFDTYTEQANVTTHTDMIWKMMMVDEDSKDATSGKSDPPLVAFEWGAFYFTAVITSLSQKFTLFLADGTPVRTTVDITLEQAEVPDDYQPQTSSTATAAQPKVVTATSSDRMDTIAANETGDASNHRDIAEKNNIDNPNKVPPGTAVTV
jgi:hypothetical protein